MQVGDQVFGINIYTFNNRYWRRLYTILAIEDRMRFGKPSQLMTVKVETVYLDDINQKRTVHDRVLRWSTDLV